MKFSGQVTRMNNILHVIKYILSTCCYLFNSETCDYFYWSLINTNDPWPGATGVPHCHKAIDNSILCLVSLLINNNAGPKPFLIFSASYQNVFLSQWDPHQAQSLATFTDHQHVVYSAVWSPHVARTFASASGMMKLHKV